MKYIPGPDFPTGGVIVDSEKLEDIYTFGVEREQGKYEIGLKQFILSSLLD